MDEADVAFAQSLAAFMSACTPIEQHLMEGKPLTDTNLELISTVTLGLQTALVVWKQKNGNPINRPANLDGQS